MAKIGIRKDCFAYDYYPYSKTKEQCSALTVMICNSRKCPFYKNIEKRNQEVRKRGLRDTTYDDYGIDKERYLELKHFCLQYDRKKAKIEYSGAKGISYDGMPHGSTTGRPTEKEAIRNVMRNQDCQMIEEAARKCHPVIAPYILKCVTKGLPYEYLGNVPVCRQDFYGYRRLFFHYLDEARK